MIKTYLINSSTAQYTDEELQWLQSNLFKAGILGDKDTGNLGYQVSEQDTPSMNVDVSIGKALVEVTISGKTFKVIVESNDVETVAIPSNVSGSDRVDAIIIRVDKDTEPNTLKTNVGTVERVNGDGPTALSDGDIDTAVSGDGWYRLADVTVEDSASSIVNGNILDQRAKCQTTSAFNISDENNPALTENDTTQGGVDQQQTSFTSAISFGEADSSGNNSKLVQSFIPTKSKIRSVELYKKANTGTYVGDVTISIQAGVSGVPSGVALATVTILNADWNNLADDSAFIAIFDSEYSGLNTSEEYFIVAESSTNDASNNPTLGGSTGNPYANGASYFQNADDGFVEIALTDLYFKTYEGIINQVVKTGDDGKIKSVLKKPIVQVYTSNDVWVKPAGLSYVIVELVGGGGGGDSCGNDDAGAGGGAGGYSKKSIDAVDLDNLETVTVGAGGTAQTNGGSSSFGSHCSATGGSGATNKGTGGSGGVGSNGDVNIKGGGGVAGDTYFGGSSTSAQSGGAGGSSVLGGGGHSKSPDSGGSTGGNYGGGGGGAASNGSSKTGGTGGSGVVIVTEFY